MITIESLKEQTILKIEKGTPYKTMATGIEMLMEILIENECFKDVDDLLEYVKIEYIKNIDNKINESIKIEMN